MKLQYLGTAAAEGIPALFCNCDVCENARAVGGKEIRTRSQAILDDKILIDFPPDTYMHVLNNKLRIDSIHTLLITHSHGDHLHEHDFWCRKKGIANNIEEVPLDVYAAESGYEISVKLVEKEHIDEDRVCVHKICEFQPFFAEEYKIIPLLADHDPLASSVFFIIEKDDKTLLYAHDTGYFPEATWDYLSGYNRKFDMISLDCCGAVCDYRKGHMGIPACKDVVRRLKELSLCDEKTIVCLNHFSHNGKASHEQIEQALQGTGFIVSYDGMVAEF